MEEGTSCQFQAVTSPARKDWNKKEGISEVPMYRSAPVKPEGRSRFPPLVVVGWHEGSGTSLVFDNEDLPGAHKKYRDREQKRNGLWTCVADYFRANNGVEGGAGPVGRVSVRGKTGKFKMRSYDPEKGAGLTGWPRVSFMGVKGLDKLDPALQHGPLLADWVLACRPQSSAEARLV